MESVSHVEQNRASIRDGADIKRKQSKKQGTLQSLLGLGLQGRGLDKAESMESVSHVEQNGASVRDGADIKRKQSKKQGTLMPLRVFRWRGGTTWSLSWFGGSDPWN